ncbi:hypothetical protein FRC01_004930 [Tulasnella sp. 417]|nr:hypothetical protein FRC01_004930 [Tulasnella sp. 417]
MNREKLSDLQARLSALIEEFRGDPPDDDNTNSAIDFLHAVCTVAMDRMKMDVVYPGRDSATRDHDVTGEGRTSNALPSDKCNLAVLSNELPIGRRPAGANVLDPDEALFGMKLTGHALLPRPLLKDHVPETWAEAFTRYFDICDRIIDVQPADVDEWIETVSTSCEETEGDCAIRFSREFAEWVKMISCNLDSIATEREDLEIVKLVRRVRLLVKLRGIETLGEAFLGMKLTGHALLPRPLLRHHVPSTWADAFTRYFDICDRIIDVQPADVDEWIETVSTSCEETEGNCAIRFTREFAEWLKVCAGAAQSGRAIDLNCKDDLMQSRQHCYGKGRLGDREIGSAG